MHNMAVFLVILDRVLGLLSVVRQVCHFGTQIRGHVHRAARAPPQHALVKALAQLKRKRFVHKWQQGREIGNFVVVFVVPRLVRGVVVGLLTSAHQRHGRHTTVSHVHALHVGVGRPTHRHQPLSAARPDTVLLHVPRVLFALERAHRFQQRETFLAVETNPRFGRLFEGRLHFCLIGVQRHRRQG